MRDWNYTRESDIRHIRMRGDWSGYNHPIRRLGRFLRDYVRRGDDWCSREGRRIAWRHPLIHAQVTLSTETHMPDGVLDGGAIITHWEETGEYLQYVQPSVGALLADLMDAHPDLPEVQAIADEMKRINDGYGERIANEAPTTAGEGERGEG
jgi:hypothetical protein